jgi:hypothetical protein
MKTYVILFFLICFTVGHESFAQIQRRPAPQKPEREKRSEENLLQNDFTFDVKLGNVGFFRNLFLSSKVNGGYKFNNWLSAGLGGKIFYTQVFITGAKDDVYVDYGGFVYSRAKFLSKFYGQLEYHFTTFDYVNSQFPGADLHYPAISAGYMSGGDKWKFGIELSFIVDELARDYQGSVVEYWFGATYNF